MIRPGWLFSVLLPLSLASCQTSASKQTVRAAHYFHLTTSRQIMPVAQPWEGNQFPHTLSVLELNRDGFRFWGWYGLNEGRGIGLARSNDLVNWTKYESNPLWTNARWPSVLKDADPQHPDLLYYAITRDYDTPSSYIVMATSADGIHLTQEKTLVAAVPNERNQNPNLFRDPRSGRFYLTFYRGNDRDRFEIISKSAATVTDLDTAPEKVLLKSETTLAAPTLLFVEQPERTAGADRTYYLATEVYPHRFGMKEECARSFTDCVLDNILRRLPSEWEVKVFASDAPDGEFHSVGGNPILQGQRACLFQYIFNGRFYGYDCHLQTPNKWVLEEVEATP